MKVWRVILILLILVSTGSLIVAHDINRYLNQPIGDQDDHVVITIPKGAGFRKIASSLQRKGIIEKPLYWTLLAHLNEQTHRIKSGEYQLSYRSTPVEILQQLVDGKVMLHKLTIIEGVTFNEFWNQVRSEKAIKLQLTSKDELKDRLQIDHDSLEGLFLPDTYSFSKDDSDIEIFRQSHELLTDYLMQQWETRAEGLPYETPYDALIMASIVEKETSVNEERPLIAGVFVQRLKKQMKLQTDPTVIYGLGEQFDGNLRKRDLLNDTPYNTYVRNGLPPGPICLAGRASIEAALHPTDTEYLFFVSKGDGTHYFSKQYSEHEDAVRKYQLGQ
jgi:UPF0755 protein